MTEPEGAHDARLPAAETAPSSDIEPEILAIGSSPARHRSPLTTMVTIVVSALVGALVVVAGLVGEVRSTGSEWKQCPSSGTDLDRVRALAEAEQRALVSADAEQLSLILASDYVQITPNGDSWSRDDLVGTIVSGELKFETLEISALGPTSPWTSKSTARPRSCGTAPRLTRLSDQHAIDMRLDTRTCTQNATAAGLPCRLS